jgi:hypothetical protein
MSLKSIKFNRHSYTVGEDVIELRGLSFNDFSYLMQTREKEIDQALAYINSDASKENIALWALANVPGLMVDMIVLSADEPDAVQNVTRLPIPTQIELIEKVLDATFKDAGGFANFIQTVALKFANATGSLQQMTAGLKSQR